MASFIKNLYKRKHEIEQAQKAGEDGSLKKQKKFTKVHEFSDFFGICRTYFRQHYKNEFWLKNVFVV